MPSRTVRAWCEEWLRSKVHNTKSSQDRYAKVAERFLASLGVKSDRDLSVVNADDVARFTTELAEKLSPNSARLGFKIARMMLSAAVKRQVISANPAAGLPTPKARKLSERRPFTMAELRALLSAAGEGEWRGMILFGYYQGMRLGDVCRLTWRAVDIEKKLLNFRIGKTGEMMHVPLDGRVARYLETRGGDDLDAPIFQRAANAARTGSLSNQFHGVMRSAGLIPISARHEKSSGRGRDAARQPVGLGFHCLRLTSSTMMRAAGISNGLVDKLFGWRTDEGLKTYTQFSAEDLRPAFDALPSV
jgi:integrase